MKTSPHTYKRANESAAQPKSATCRALYLAAIAALLAHSTERVQASTLTWDGDTDVNWATGTNWVGDPAAPVSGDYLIFGAGNEATLTNDVAADSSFQIQITGDGYDLTGNRITLNNIAWVIEQKAGSGTNTISLDILDTGGDTRIDVEEGTLILAGALTGGVNLLNAGDGTLWLKNAGNVYAGTYVLGGTLAFDNGALGTGNIRLGWGGNDGRLEYRGSGAETVTNGVEIGGGTSHSGGGIISNNSADSSTLTFSAPTFNVVKSTTLIRDIEFNGASDIEVQGVIADNTGAAITLTKDGSNTLTLSGANTYTGGTTLSAGTLVLGDAAAAGTGTITLAGGTLQTSGLTHSNAISATGATDVVVSGSLFTGAFTGTGTLTFSGGGSTTQSSILNTDLSGFSGTIRHDNTSPVRLNIWNTTNTDNVKIFTTGESNTANTGLRFLGGNYTIAELSGDGGRIQGRSNTLTVNQSTDTTYSGVLAEDGGRPLTFIKDGSGSLTLSGASSYTGTTTVSGGTLSLASGYTHTGGGAYTVEGGTLKIADGVNIGSAMTISLGGVIAPGNSPGTATTGSQTWNDGGTYEWEINDSGGLKGDDPGWDWLDITGTLDLTNLSAGGFTIDIDSLTASNVAGDAVGFDTFTKGDGIFDYSFTIATASGGITGFDAANFTLDSSGFSNAPSWDWQIVLSGSDLVLQAYAVPEPSSTALLGLGGLVLALRRKRS